MKAAGSDSHDSVKLKRGNFGSLRRKFGRERVALDRICGRSARWRRAGGKATPIPGPCSCQCTGSSRGAYLSPPLINIGRAGARFAAQRKEGREGLQLRTEVSRERVPPPARRSADGKMRHTWGLPHDAAGHRSPPGRRQTREMGEMNKYIFRTDRVLGRRVAHLSMAVLTARGRGGRVCRGLGASVLFPRGCEGGVLPRGVAIVVARFSEGRG